MPKNKKKKAKKVEVLDAENDTAEASDIALAADLLPTDILIIPGSSKPMFPGMVIPLLITKGPGADMLTSIFAQDNPVAGVVLTRSELEETDPESITRELCEVGTVARIVSLEVGDDETKVLLEGVARFELKTVSIRDGHIFGTVEYLKSIESTDDRAKAMSLSILNTLRELSTKNPIYSEEIKMFLNRGSWDEPGSLADFAAVFSSAATRDELQEVLESLDVTLRLERALFLLRKELDLNALKERITHQIEERISKQQRDFFLHEQLKAIKEELGLEKDAKSEEIDRFTQHIKNLELTDEARGRIDGELTKLRLLMPESAEFGVVRNYLDWLTGLPWGGVTEDNLDVSDARLVLDRDHAGLDDVKERILEFVGVSKLRGTVEGSILCLVGPPGVGKTSLGRAVAESLGRKFYRFSVGGMRDEAEIKGHRRTYIGAMPGKIAQALRTSESDNPVIMLDEIDKIGKSYQGDPASALLEVLDPEQNPNFRDHYLDVAYDLSKVLFIATANVLDTIPPPLLDRMEVIRLSGYIEQEKVAIARKHLIPRLRPKHGLKSTDVRFTDAGIRAIISGYAREAGVRALEKALRGCMRKVAVRKAEGTLEGTLTVSSKSVSGLLGQPVFADDTMLENQIGVVRGLAWTALGGSVLYIEAIGVPGKRDFRLTGQLGDVMTESAAIAMSFVLSNAEHFNIAEDYFKDQTIHLHVPAGATPKDGPSAGVTMATALISLGSQEPLPNKLAMTGELTLTGAVLPVGGIREKIIAARRAGVNTVILPQDNRKDFEEIPEDVRKGVTPQFVGHYNEVYSLVFEDD